MVLNKKFPKSSIHIATNNYFHKTQAQTAKQSSCLYTVQKKKHSKTINIWNLHVLSMHYN